MKFISVAFLVVATLVASIAAQDKYTTKYDNINVDEILSSDRLLNNYFNCLMDRGSCTPDAQELKKAIPDALKTECSKCSEKQKKVIDKVCHFLIEKKPDHWKELQAKYDPQNIYYNKYKSHI
ncbi:ejaculatory bulb-specific protein 3 [Musca domestica]|uniref:Ejaculatory bulb-specific protein 3 n=1 Tax=Musca domestica TaxID=7370 RepID=A0A1I8MJZ0_MUSDO|nr:ejaculatory bulb-specific protein 3 [Musca domestica]XP_058987079.1 ejaculatory bulb-specific protein 3 [Musca domestica]